MFARILGGLLLCTIGGVLCYYAHWLVQQFGRSARAELHLGGTRNLIILVGFVMMIIGVLMMFGVVGLGGATHQLPQGFAEVK